MKTNHIHFATLENQVYCYRHDEIVTYNRKFVNEACQGCPFYNGSNQGQGVECQYRDGSDLPLAQYSDPHDAEREAHTLREKVLGVKS